MTLRGPRRLDPAAYAVRESWYGSYYELAIEVSLSPADARLATSLRALWESPRLQGPWKDMGTAGKIVRLEPPPPDSTRTWYGILTVDELGELPCIVGIVREAGDMADWLNLSIPTQALADRGLGDLVHEAPLELLAPIDSALIEIGALVFTNAEFLLAAIGEETSGMHSSASFGPDAGTMDSFLVPRALWDRTEHIIGAKEIVPGLKLVSARR